MKDIYTIRGRMRTIQDFWYVMPSPAPSVVFANQKYGGGVSLAKRHFKYRLRSTK